MIINNLQYLKALTRNLPLQTKLWMVIRFLMLDPQLLDHHLPHSGILYDLGCGNGIIAGYLSFISKRKVIGIDSDKQKIAIARKTLGFLPKLSFRISDITAMRFSKASGFILSDFLHHISQKKQELLLKKIYRNLAKEGVLIIKEINSGDLFRKWLSRFWDFLFYPEDKIYYRTSRDWELILTNIGFSVEVKESVRWFPGSTNFFICTKKN